MTFNYWLEKALIRYIVNGVSEGLFKDGDFDCVPIGDILDDYTVVTHKDGRSWLMSSEGIQLVAKLTKGQI